MSSKFSKNSVDINYLLVDVEIILNSGKILNFTCPVTEIMEFVDCLINNPAVTETNRLSEYFKNRYYVFNDYKKSKSIMINLDEIQSFTIPFLASVNEKEFEYREIKKV
jgi:heme oxygenase